MHKSLIEVLLTRLGSHSNRSLVPSCFFCMDFACCFKSKLKKACGLVQKVCSYSWHFNFFILEFGVWFNIGLRTLCISVCLSAANIVLFTVCLRQVYLENQKSSLSETTYITIGWMKHKYLYILKSVLFSHSYEQEFD